MILVVQQSHIDFVQLLNEVEDAEKGYQAPVDLSQELPLLFCRQGCERLLVTKTIVEYCCVFGSKDCPLGAMGSLEVYPAIGVHFGVG